MKWFRSILLIFTGVVSIYLGIIMHNADTGEIEAIKEYGGEAYTGIQNAEVRTGANVYWQSNIIKSGFSTILCLGGLVIIAFAIPNKDN